MESSNTPTILTGQIIRDQVKILEEKCTRMTADTKLFQRLREHKTGTMDIETWADRHTRKKIEKEGTWRKKGSIDSKGRECFRDVSTIVTLLNVKINETKKSDKMLRGELRIMLTKLRSLIGRKAYKKDRELQYEANDKVWKKVASKHESKVNGLVNKYSKECNKYHTLYVKKKGGGYRNRS